MDHDESLFKEAQNETELEFDMEQDVAEETVMTLFAIAGIIANVLLIYIICRFRKLHTNNRIYLVNWAIANIGASILIIVCFEIFFGFFEAAVEFWYFYFGLECALTTIVLLFMFLLTVDWCLTAYLPRQMEWFQKYTKIFVAAIWICSILNFVVVVFLSEYIYTLFAIILGLLLLFIVVLHCIRLVQKYRMSVEYHPVAPLMIPTAFVACWVLCWNNLFLLEFYDLPYFVYWISDSLFFLHPVINLVLLIFVDKEFNMCFLQTCKCLPFKVLKSSTDTSTENDSNNIL